MVLNIYSVRDIHVGFGSPFCEANDHAAKRGFGMAIKNPGTLLDFASADFGLYRVGLIDTDTGKIEPVWPVELIMDGAAVHG